MIKFLAQEHVKEFEFQVPAAWMNQGNKHGNVIQFPGLYLSRCDQIFGNKLRANETKLSSSKTSKDPLKTAFCHLMFINQIPEDQNL